MQIDPGMISIYDDGVVLYVHPIVPSPLLLTSVTIGIVPVHPLIPPEDIPSSRALRIVCRAKIGGRNGGYIKDFRRREAKASKG